MIWFVQELEKDHLNNASKYGVLLGEVLGVFGSVVGLSCLSMT